MTTLGYSARVGIVVLIAIGVFFGIIWFLRDGLTGNQYYKVHVLFDDASGADKGVDVTMAGVAIGQVDNITLTKGLRAELTLSIKKRWVIPQGSRFLISVAPLGDVGVVTVVPPPDAGTRQYPAIRPGAVVNGGAQEADFTGTLNNANALMGSFQVTVQKINKLLDQTSALVADPSMQKGLHQSFANMQMLSHNGVVLTQEMNSALVDDNAQVTRLLTRTQAGMDANLKNVTATTTDIRSLADSNKDNINQIVGNLRDTTAAVEGITEETNDMLKKGGLSKNMSAVMANMNETTRKLDALAGNLEQISANAQMQGDLAATVHNLRLTTEQTDVMVRRINHLIGVKENAAEPASAPTTPTKSSESAAPAILPRVDMYENTREHRFQADVDAFMPFGNTGGFGQVGIFDAGNTNRLDLEYGTLAPAGSLFDYRMGVHDSRLALGGDWGLGRRESISADLYDPNYAHLDVLGSLMLNPNIGLLVGGDDLTKRSSAVIGVELRR